MKQLKYYALAIFAVLVYIQIRVLKSVIIWKGLPNIQTWVTEKEIVHKDITGLIFLWINLTVLLIFGWFWFILGLIFQLIILLTLFIVVLVKSNRALKNSGYEKTN